MNINLTKETKQKLFQYAENAGVTPEAIIERFVSDLTQTDGMTNDADASKNLYKWYSSSFKPVYNIYQSICEIFFDMDALIAVYDGFNDKDSDLHEYYAECLNDLKENYYEYNEGDFDKELKEIIARYKEI